MTQNRPPSPLDRAREWLRTLPDHAWEQVGTCDLKRRFGLTDREALYAIQVERGG